MLVEEEMELLVVTLVLEIQVLVEEVIQGEQLLMQLIIEVVAVVDLVDVMLVVTVVQELLL